MKQMQETETKKTKQQKWIKQEEKKENFWIGLGKDVLWAAAVLLIFFYLCWPMRIVGGSMEPSYKDGDIVCVSHLSGLYDKYQRGDTVIFTYTEKGENHTVIKRIIAMEGDHISILPEGVFLNGKKLEEPYVMGKTEGFVDMTVPKDTVFVLGDHREKSFDSRNMGVIAKDAVKGKVLFRLFSPQS